LLGRGSKVFGLVYCWWEDDWLLDW